MWPPSKEVPGGALLLWRQATSAGLASTLAKTSHRVVRATGSRLHTTQTPIEFAHSREALAAIASPDQACRANDHDLRHDYRFFARGVGLRGVKDPSGGWRLAQTESEAADADGFTVR
jgi:hypothetical protein